uniref:Uncharacterized protein n=1 Tax=Candidatus Kentrum sp. LPFa TaxID=2126335 RepID=A0A450X528_9GAMM|nr:MAG: hypothetical protein BECKLPF1236A_GA0070988_1006816 [Candidatus Kentron sp. LPFa]VFK24320.1 MAG: hypothetical protein BECKLPF1236C_GA0070990_1001226 [Candidatus Kentron sp. LPFa]
MNMLARSNRLQTGCSLRRRQFFGDFCFSDTYKLRPLRDDIFSN